MGNLLTIPGTFVANTRAKAAEVNAKFTSVYEALTDGGDDIYTNGYRLSRSALNDVTLTGSECMMLAYFNLNTNTTYHLATSTARLVCAGEFAINSSASLIINSGAEALIYS